MMKTIMIISTILTSIVAQDCLQSCTISTYGSNWDYANVRPNPCNNRRPTTKLFDGDTVYNLNKNTFGCGYWYTQVLTSDNKVGWVSSQFLDCNGNPPVAAATLPVDKPDVLL